MMKCIFSKDSNLGFSYWQDRKDLCTYLPLFWPNIIVRLVIFLVIINAVKGKNKMMAMTMMDFLEFRDEPKVVHRSSKAQGLVRDLSQGCCCWLGNKYGLGTSVGPSHKAVTIVKCIVSATISLKNSPKV